METQSVDNKFKFISIAAARCQQLQRGARPRVEPRSRKPTTVAQDEVRQGLVVAREPELGGAPRRRAARNPRPPSPREWMSNKRGPEIALGISGGIGAYKTPELVRALVHAGIGVTAILTKNAEAFVTPLTLQTVTGRPVIRDLYDLSAADVEHIDLARRISLLAVAPATAATLRRVGPAVAHG